MVKTALMSELKWITAQSVEKFKKWAGKGPVMLVSGRDKEPVGVYMPIKLYESLVGRPETEKRPSTGMKFCACGSTHGDTHTNGCDGVEWEI